MIWLTFSIPYCVCLLLLLLQLLNVKGLVLWFIGHYQNALSHSMACKFPPVAIRKFWTPFYLVIFRVHNTWSAFQRNLVNGKSCTSPAPMCQRMSRYNESGFCTDLMGVLCLLEILFDCVLFFRSHRYPPILRSHNYNSKKYFGKTHWQNYGKSTQA